MAVKRAGAFKINTLARYRPRVVLQSAQESLAASARRVIELRGSSGSDRVCVVGAKRF